MLHVDIGYNTDIQTEVDILSESKNQRWNTVKQNLDLKAQPHMRLPLDMDCYGRFRVTVLA